MRYRYFNICCLSIMVINALFLLYSCHDKIGSKKNTISDEQRRLRAELAFGKWVDVPVKAEWFDMKLVDFLAMLERDYLDQGIMLRFVFPPEHYDEVKQNLEAKLSSLVGQGPSNSRLSVLFGVLVKTYLGTSTYQFDEITIYIRYENGKFFTNPRIGRFSEE